MLGRCYLRVAEVAQAKEAFVRAKDEDTCPLRMLESMHQALRRVAAASGTPLVDARRLFEGLSPDGIPGEELLLDHVHPSIRGHQLIADALLGEVMRVAAVHPRPGWEARRDLLYRRHLERLEAPYFVRGRERLDGQRKWTQGRAFRQVRRVQGR